MQGVIGQFFFVAFAAFLWAKAEVEIEGKDGWAKNLPTWRIEKHILLDIFLGGRALTGYHVWVFSFVLCMFHAPLLGNAVWSVSFECLVLGWFCLFWVMEDFFWFLINPYYGIKHHRAKDVPWHPRWFLGFPSDHWGLLVVGVILITGSRYIAH